MLTINGATHVRSTYGFARSKSSEGISMPGGWQWTFRKWNGLRDRLRRIIRRMTGDKRSSMPATPGGKPLITNENGLSGWRTTRVGQNSTAKTRAKIIDCRTVPRDRHSGARVPRFFPALPEEVQRVFPSFAEGIVILAVEVFAACRRHLRHDTCTAQMIRQEIVRFRIIISPDDASAAKRRTLEGFDRREIFAAMICERTSVCETCTLACLG